MNDTLELEHTEGSVTIRTVLYGDVDTARMERETKMIKHRAHQLNSTPRPTCKYTHYSELED